jgi:hypothetical protein
MSGSDAGPTGRKDAIHALVRNVVNTRYEDLSQGFGRSRRLGRESGVDGLGFRREVTCALVRDDEQLPLGTWLVSRDNRDPEAKESLHECRICS